MAIELKIPEVGESITEVQISKWLKSEGAEVQADEAVVIIDSEKTTFELPAPQAGRLARILCQAGETVKVGAVIAEIETGGAGATATPAEAKGAGGRKPKPGRKAGPGRAGESPKAAEAGEAEPAGAGSTAAPERKPEEAGVAGTAPREEAQPERETPRQPAEAGAEATSAPAETAGPEKPADDRDEEVVPMTMLRRTVARRLVAAQQQMAMLTTFNEADMSAVQTLRQEQKEAFEGRHQVKLGLMSFFVKACVDALKQFPQLNAEIRDNDIVYRNYFNLGVAMATGRGLVVPVLRRAERLSFADVEKAVREAGQRAEAGQLTPAELEGATFTITNGGVFGSLLSTPIINPPQAGILGMHAIQERPVAVAGQVVIRPMMYLALTYDHRLVDGREAVRFLGRIKEAIENPARMLLEV